MNKDTYVLYVKEITDRNAVLVNDVELETIPKYKLPSELVVGEKIMRDSMGMYKRVE